MRQSVTRIEKAGFTFSMETLSEVDEETMAELERVSEAWRAGADERGFTMALERLGDAQQHETVVAIARDDEGHVRGFLHFVPSYGRAGGVALVHAPRPGDARTASQSSSSPARSRRFARVMSRRCRSTSRRSHGC